jgi:hypothetical protein
MNKVKTDIRTLSKVFHLLEKMGFEDIPVFDENDKFFEQFISSLVLNLGETPDKLNDLFCSITGESRDFLDDNLDSLCEIAQNFFDNTPVRFKNTIQTLIDVQNQQRLLAIQEMKKNMSEIMSNLEKNIIEGIPTQDMNYALDNMESLLKD